MSQQLKPKVVRQLVLTILEKELTEASDAFVLASGSAAAFTRLEAAMYALQYATQRSGEAIVAIVAGVELLYIVARFAELAYARATNHDGVEPLTYPQV